MFKIGEKLKIVTEGNEEYIGTLSHICLGVNEEEHPTLASIILKDDVFDYKTYEHVHIFCINIAKIERYKN
jgi:hypothetical protein